MRQTTTIIHTPIAMGIVRGIFASGWVRPDAPLRLPYRGLGSMPIEALKWPPALTKALNKIPIVNVATLCELRLDELEQLMTPANYAERVQRKLKSLGLDLNMTPGELMSASDKPSPQILNLWPAVNSNFHKDPATDTWTIKHTSLKSAAAAPTTKAPNTTISSPTIEATLKSSVNDVLFTFSSEAEGQQFIWRTTYAFNEILKADPKAILLGTSQESETANPIHAIGRKYNGRQSYAIAMSRTMLYVLAAEIQHHPEIIEAIRQKEADGMDNELVLPKELGLPLHASWLQPRSRHPETATARA